MKRAAVATAFLVALAAAAAVWAQPMPRPDPRRAHALQLRRDRVRSVLRLAEAGVPVYCGGGRLPQVALTFDDGPGPSTPALLALLRRFDAHGTFFDVGTHVGYWPDLVRREWLEGAVGDHTWSHRKLPPLAQADLFDQLRWGAVAISRATHRRVLLFRPPFGEHNDAVDRTVRQLGMLQVLWSVDSRDAEGATVRQIERNVLERLRPGAIVLLHDNHSTTLAALRRAILPALKRRGLRAVTVPELLASDPPRRLWLGQRACPWPGPEYP